MQDTAAQERAVIFVVEPDERERGHIQDALDRAGHVAMALPAAGSAALLLQNGAACDLVVLGVDAMEDDPSRFDLIQNACQPPPPIVLYGIDAETEVVLHCLNRGAADFLAKPVCEAELVNAVQTLVARDVPADSDDTEAIRADQHVEGWIELTATSRLEQFRRLQRFSDALFASRLPSNVVEDMKMAVEEVGRNAVEWGNRFDPDKQVHVSYCVFDDRVVIKVEDEGEGFAPQSLPDPTRDPVATMQKRMEDGKRPGGYGVFLIQKLMDETIYNEKGNVVLLIKYLPQAEPEDR